MAPVRRVVVDVLKPHDPALVEFTERVTETEGVEGVTSSLVELDEEVRNVELTVEGTDLDFGTVEQAIENLGATVHSVDQVVCGDGVVADRRPPRDREP